tara:strand:+ start:515 stop:673 length:159 start_codon:yes stop_codon:yes gene_type:complete
MEHEDLDTVIRAIEKVDLNVVELANVIAEAFKDCYGTHNYEEFKKVINEKLK